MSKCGVRFLLQEKLNTDYEDHVVPLAEAHKHRTGGKAVMTFELFKRASSLVASRAFGVDSYHGDAMLPIADLFNHTGNEHVHIESDGDACEECGSPDPCPHRPEEVISARFFSFFYFSLPSVNLTGLLPV